MAAKRKIDYLSMFDGTPFVFKSIDRVEKKIYFLDGELLCCCSLNKFPPKTRGIKIAVDKTDAFINEANKRHGFKYSYESSCYSGADEEIVVTCKEHGNFKTTPHEHLSKLHGCKWCKADSSRITNEEILVRCINKHGNTYEYDFSGYKGSIKGSYIRIYCAAHGWFSQSPYNHYKQGQGCRECGKLVQGGKSLADHKTSSIKYGGTSFLYLIKCYNEVEIFYKIGISVSGVMTRFSSSNLPYRYEVIKEKSFIADVTWNLEKKLLEDYSAKKYVPEHRFRGYTECLKLDASDIFDILNFINKHE